MGGLIFGRDGDGHYACIDTGKAFGVVYELIQRPAGRIPPEIIYPAERTYERRKRMSDYPLKKEVRLVFEATNHLEMGKFVNTAANHRRMIEFTGCDNLGIQLD